MSPPEGTMRRFDLSVLAVGLLLGCGGGDDDGDGGLFEQQVECEGASIEPLAGSQQQVISFIEIGGRDDGFDLDRDGEVDNQLYGVSDLARDGIQDSFDKYDIIAPVEFFDFDQPAADDCVKFAVYLGKYKLDSDGDGQVTARGDGDCNDLEEGAMRGATEIADNFMDDDCDGLADDDNDTPSIDDMDHDDDGVTIEGGDCDDTRAEVKGDVEICGDGLDNDCDGVADWGLIGDSPACTPYDEATPDRLVLDPASFNADGSPVIAFTAGEVVEEDGKLMLHAGPALFSINLPIQTGLALDLTLTGATIEGELYQTSSGWAIRGARLGGVIDARTADNVRGIEVPDIELNPEDSLLDAIFANVLGVFLALPKSDNEMYSNCHVPDIDVDQDGLEIFCDSAPDDNVKTVDMCIDGDGTVVMDQGAVQCTDAVDDQGNYRFADGISVALNFETVPAVLASE
jgi:hypothetical protein